MFRFWIIFLCVFSLYAKSSDDHYYRSFWNPSYHGALLNYCTLDNKACGNQVATQYCQLFGYEKAIQAIKAYNVGVTKFLSTDTYCKGYACAGFQLIKCINRMQHKPVKAYYYRMEKFVLPRWHHFRVDWCYQKGKACGKRAAYSFCRRLGYLKAASFEMDQHVPATKAIGDNSLCFGNTCRGFKVIQCYR